MHRLSHLRIHRWLGYLLLGLLLPLAFGIANAQTDSGTTETPTQEVIENMDKEQTPAGQSDGMVNNYVTAWGSSSAGGDLTGKDSKFATGVPKGELENVQDIFSTKNAFAALKENGSIVTWGDSTLGGNLTGEESDKATGVTGEKLENVQDIFSTRGAFAALKEDSSIVTWGNSSAGGDLTGKDSKFATGVTGGKLENVQDIFSTGAAFAALKENSSIVTWGHSAFGGDLTGEDSDIATGVLRGELDNVQEIFSTGAAFAAIVEGSPTNSTSWIEQLLKFVVFFVMVGTVIFIFAINDESRGGTGGGHGTL